MFHIKAKLNARQQVLTAAQFRTLVSNFESTEKAGIPVVKFFDPFSTATWLISELDPESGLAYGLCDLGQGFPEIGYVSLYELMDLKRIERDLHFKSQRTLSEWKAFAEKNGNLVGI